MSPSQLRHASTQIAILAAKIRWAVNDPLERLNQRMANLNALNRVNRKKAEK